MSYMNLNFSSNDVTYIFYNLLYSRITSGEILFLQLLLKKSTCLYYIIFITTNKVAKKILRISYEDSL